MREISEALKATLEANEHISKVSFTEDGSHYFQVNKNTPEIIETLTREEVLGEKKVAKSAEPKASKTTVQKAK